MDEINQMHQVNIDWGCVANLMDKIGNIEDSLEEGWPELADMVVDAVYEESNRRVSPEHVFFNLNEYFWRLYYRLKANSEPRKFNKIVKTTIEGKELYRIHNYDYQMYKWAKAGGFANTITNDYIDVYANKLSDKQRRAFGRRCE